MAALHLKIEPDDVAPYVLLSRYKVASGKAKAGARA